MAPPSPETLKFLHRTLFRWYSANGRSFLWRSTRDPYVILVSEIMLQQTQVGRVEQKLPAFLRRFPGFRELAGASNAEIIRAWQGMGYNSRALRLRDCAASVVERHHGRLPRDPAGLLTLSGIGPYTSHAVACFAFRRQVPLVDVNIRRVISRLFWHMSSRDAAKPDRVIWETARAVLPVNAYTWNQALMDFGSLVCTARKPHCGSCPVRPACRSRHLEHISERGKRSEPRRAEPGYGGIARRIWRGKLVETLRTLPRGRKISVRDLVVSVKPDYTRRDLPWFQTLLSTLAREGIVSASRKDGCEYIRLAG